MGARDSSDPEKSQSKFSANRAKEQTLILTSSSQRQLSTLLQQQGKMLQRQFRPALLHNERRGMVEGVIFSFRQFSVTQQLKDDSPSQPSGMWNNRDPKFIQTALLRLCPFTFIFSVSHLIYFYRPFYFICYHTLPPRSSQKA